MNTPIAIITGAGRGIGRAIAIELAKHDYRLVLSARTKTELADTARLAGNATIVAGDLTKPAHINRLIAKTISTHGRLDCLINNAGYAPKLSIEQMTSAEWEKILATNLSAPFYLCKLAWPIFVKQKAGVIVNISSFASRDPFPGLGAYGAAKAGLNLLSLDLARQGALHNIRVHTLALAAVETAMFRKLRTRKQFPTEKTLSPADVAQAVYDCIAGPLRHTSGETIYLRKNA